MGYVVIRVDYLRSHGLENSCVGDQNPTGEVVPDKEIAAGVTPEIREAWPIVSGRTRSDTHRTQAGHVCGHGNQRF